MEYLGVWQFYDERPLWYKDLKDVFEEYGKVESVYLNRHLPLTQTIVLAIKNNYK